MIRLGALLGGISLLTIGAMVSAARQDDGKKPTPAQEEPAKEKPRDLLVEPDSRDPWEYRLVPMGEFSAREPLPVLQQLGRAGWEMAGTLPDAKGGPVAVFKRPKPVRELPAK